MARKPRLNIRDGVYHVMNRGLERRAIVRDDHDRQQWLRLFARVSVRRRWRVFAYALLDNHFHIFLRTPQGDLSQGMHDFQSGYVTLFNKRHDRPGPLFQGRFKAILVEHETYGWALSRYVHLNPVWAGLCVDPIQYRWCSYRHYLDPRFAPKWLDWRTILCEIGGNESQARMQYKRFVQAGLGDRPRDPFEHVRDGWLLGSDAFVERMRDGGGQVVQSSMRPELNPAKADTLRPAALNFEPPDPSPDLTLDRIIEQVAGRFGMSATEVTRTRGRKNLARDVAMLLARELLDAPVEELANRFSVGKSAVSEAVRRARQRMQRDSSIAELISEL